MVKDRPNSKANFKTCCSFFLQFQRWRKTKKHNPCLKFDRFTFRYFFPRLFSKINMTFPNVEFNSKPEIFKAQISILSKDIQKMFLE